MIEIIVEDMTAGMECQECGKKFRAKLKTLEYGKTKCPKCKSTDLDFAFGAKNESSEIEEWGPAAIVAKQVIDKKKKEKEEKEKINNDTMSTSSAIDMNPTGKQGKEVSWKPAKKKKLKEARKYETFKVTDDCFNKFRNGKTKFERWSKYLDLGDESQKRIYDWARRNHKGVIVLQNATTGAVRGIRYNRSGGGQWGKLTRVKEQFQRNNDNFSQLDEDVLDVLRNIVKNKQYQKVKFADKKTATVDGFTASAMVQVYDAINKDNQAKFKEMINKNLKGFMAMQSFAMKQVK